MASKIASHAYRRLELTSKVEAKRNGIYDAVILLRKVDDQQHILKH